MAKALSGIFGGFIRWSNGFFLVSGVVLTKAFMSTNFENASSRVVTFVFESSHFGLKTLIFIGKSFPYGLFAELKSANPFAAGTVFSLSDEAPPNTESRCGAEEMPFICAG